MYKSLKYIISILLFAGLLKAGGFALSGVGARALSMGGAFRAISDDWSAGFWNPAGISYLEGNLLALNLLGIRPSASFEPNTGILGYDGPYSLRYKVNAYPQNFYIPSFAYLTPYEINDGKLAISFVIPFGLGSKWDLYDFPIGYYNTVDASFQNPEYEKHDWQSDLKVYNLLLSYAKRFDNLRFGISLGTTRTSIMLRKVNFVDPAKIDSSATSLPIQYRLFPVDTKIEGSGWGISGNMGIIWNISEKLVLGASARLYSDVKIEGTSDLTLYFPKNDYLESQMPPQMSFMFNGSTASGTGTFSTKLSLPWNLGAGISYRPNEKLLLAFDVDWTRWWTLGKLGVDFENLVLKVNGTIPLDTIETDTLELMWRNTYRLSFGTEYAVKQNLNLRWGLYWDQSPVPNNTITVLIPDPGDKYSVNLGIGYTWKNLEFNVNYEQVLRAERAVGRDATYSYESPYLPGKYSMNVNGFGINVIYKF